jgi:hypothetical protein
MSARLLSIWSFLILAFLNAPSLAVSTLSDPLPVPIPVALRRLPPSHPDTADFSRNIQAVIFPPPHLHGLRSLTIPPQRNSPSTFQTRLPRYLAGCRLLLQRRSGPSSYLLRARLNARTSSPRDPPFCFPLS